MKTQTQETKQAATEFKYYDGMLKYPIWHCLCPELSLEEFKAMQAVVCCFLFNDKELPSA